MVVSSEDSNGQRSCGAVFARWLVAVEGGERDIEIVVGDCEDDDGYEDECVVRKRRHVFEDLRDYKAHADDSDPSPRPAEADIPINKLVVHLPSLLFSPAPRITKRKCRTKEGALAAQHGSSGWFQSAQKGAFVAWQQPASTRPLGPRHSSPCSSNSGSMPTVARLRKQQQQWQQPTVHASMHGDVARMSNRSGVGWLTNEQPLLLTLVLSMTRHDHDEAAAPRRTLLRWSSYGLVMGATRSEENRQADNKRRMENNPRDDYVQQPPYKRQNVTKAYTTGHEEKKEYDETLPLCNKYKNHHTGPCTAKCGNCKRIGHQTKDCRSLAAATNQRAPVANQRTLTFFECGKQGHYRSERPKLKNQNRGNQARSGEACGRVYALGGGKPIKTLITLQMISMLKENFFLSCLVKPKLEPIPYSIFYKNPRCTFF
ncbi:reverse transcriptase domain-containing protein [Tanacetum coccineum]